MAKDLKGANEAEQKAMDDEVAKYGFNRPAARQSDSEDEDENQDMGDLEDDNDDDEEEDTDTDENDSEDEDESEDSDEDSDEDEETEDDDEDDTTSQKKDSITKQFNKVRSQLREANQKLKEMTDKNAELEAKLPDDFQERIKTLAKEIGIEDPDNMAKIMSLVKDASIGQLKGLEKKISDLEKQVSEKNVPTVVDEFPKEWNSFEDKFKDEYPNATKEQLKEVRATMHRLAGTKDIGGVIYTHAETGQKVLSPYSLDYIYFNNRDVFEGIVTGKKSKGMETSRTRPITRGQKSDEDEFNLPQNATAAQIRAMDKKYSRLEAESDDNLRAPANNQI